MAPQNRLIICIALALSARGQTVDPWDQARAGAELLQRGQYVDSEKQFKEALVNCHSSECRQWPAILNGLGSLYYQTGRYRQAEPLVLEAPDKTESSRTRSVLASCASADFNDVLEPSSVTGRQIVEHRSLSRGCN